MFSGNGKYIMIPGRFGGDTPILFPHSESHSDVARAFGSDLPISAGFFSIVDGRFECFGKSTTLGGLESRDEDGAILTAHFRMNE